MEGQWPLPPPLVSRFGDFHSFLFPFPISHLIFFWIPAAAAQTEVGIQDGNPTLPHNISKVYKVHRAKNDTNPKNVKNRTFITKEAQHCYLQVNKLLQHSFSIFSTPTLVFLLANLTITISRGSQKPTFASHGKNYSCDYYLNKSTFYMLLILCIEP